MTVDSPTPEPKEESNDPQETWRLELTRPDGAWINLDIPEKEARSLILKYFFHQE